MRFFLFLYIHRFYLSRLVSLSLSAGLVPHFFWLTVVAFISVDLTMVFYWHWWSSLRIKPFHTLSIFTCTIVSFFNMLEYLFCIVSNASLNFLFFSKSCFFSFLSVSKKFSIWLISDLNQSVLTFQLLILAIIFQNCLIYFFKSLDSTVSLKSLP